MYDSIMIILNLYFLFIRMYDQNIYEDLVQQTLDLYFNDKIKFLTFQEFYKLSLDTVSDIQLNVIQIYFILRNSIISFSNFW